MENSNLGSLEAIPEDGQEIDKSSWILVSYKHKRVQHFKVGKFEFIKGILNIGPGPEEQVVADVEAFVKLYHGLSGQDRSSIVRLRNLQNEINVDEEPIQRTGGGTTRGPVGTNEIVSPQAETDNPAAPKPSFKVPGFLKQQ